MSMHLRHMLSASSKWLASFSSRARLFRLLAVRGSSDPNDRSLITKLRRASASASSKLHSCTQHHQLTALDGGGDVEVGLMAAPTTSSAELDQTNIWLPHIVMDRSQNNNKLMAHLCLADSCLTECDLV